MNNQPATADGVDTVDQMIKSCVQSLAMDIADVAARDLVQSFCSVTVSGKHDWYDLSTCQLEVWAEVDRALIYMDNRGDALQGYRLVRCQAFPRLVRFEERA